MADNNFITIERLNQLKDKVAALNTSRTVKWGSNLRNNSWGSIPNWLKTKESIEILGEQVINSLNALLDYEDYLPSNNELKTEDDFIALIQSAEEQIDKIAAKKDTTSKATDTYNRSGCRGACVGLCTASCGTACISGCTSACTSCYSSSNGNTPNPYYGISRAINLNLENKTDQIQNLMQKANEIIALNNKLEQAPHVSTYASCTDGCTTVCGGCYGNCTGCAGSSGGCSSLCAGDCQGNCKGDCIDLCTGCLDACRGCGGACSTNCSGCSGGCWGCWGSCSGCSGTCNGCNTTCQNTCGGSCSSGCEISCGIGCEATCSYSCYTYCTGQVAATTPNKYTQK